ncbi:signal recognition particle protein [Candidatus Woesearchaeota archaeon]|nr:signal recognition particle protein [Candidatus Woesearchaeota archaeon]
MVLEKLSQSLRDTLSKIAKSMFVDDKLLNELVKDIQRALLQADVNVKLVFALTQRIKERSSEKLPPGLTKKEHLIKIVYEELVALMGKEKAELSITKKPYAIMMVGLFGSGKTTTIGKLASYYMKRGYKVAALGLDVHRPAAPEQLVQTGTQVHIPVFINKQEKDPAAIYRQFQGELKKFDIVLIDTAGRDALSAELIKELEQLNSLIQPEQRILVISADIGQAAQRQAEQFHQSVHITGVMVTKMDGTARAGGALTACAVTRAPILFIGVGEKSADLELFNPQGFVSRMLGMGDLEALLEKAKEAMTEEEAKDLGKRFLKGDFNLIDLYEQIEAMKKMGPFSKVLEMIPGFGQLKLPKEMLEVQEDKLKHWRFAMNSMTKEELEDPDVMSQGRIERISRGAGVPVPAIREMIKQYRQSKKLMKMMKGSEQDMGKMMKKLQQMQVKMK